MSAWLDYTGGDGAGGSGGEDLYTGGSDGVGYNFDGTYSAPDVSIVAAPVDAGGGPAGSYGSAVIDVLKFGVGVWNQREARQDMLDYRRFEATQRGAYQQGQPALTFTSGGNVLGGASGIVLIAFVAAFLLLRK
ncbi:hypothetical protein ACN9MJ_12795 [Acidovorax facilis]|uniref:hypothetical protein n=1 Tax=Acidovorax facilis TaxID=12917 RepID=UPI003CF40D43